MYTTSNVNCMQFPDSSQTILPTNNTTTYESGHLPSCIVIGCKNAYSNADVKYYQVPNVNQLEAIENNNSRQWYINTLREDLLDYILSNKAGKSQSKDIGTSFSKQPHYVCFEHFDEESFLINDQGLQKNEQFTLKEDAVPSLFEIEVFQKMIAHQEQIASNQQKQISNPIPTNPPRSAPGTNFLSSLILNNDQPQNDLNSITQPQQPAQTLKPNANSQKFQSVTPINSQPGLSSNKRVRMDPDTRAALIQRVPKAVKRTSCVPAFMPQQQTTKPVNTVLKAQKAVKHTMPRSMLNHKPDHQLSISNSTTATKTQKNSKQTNLNSNIYLKDILPPPIMQSTKRPQPSVNKAVKHTGGGSHAYYQSLNQNNKNQSPKTITPINNTNDLSNKNQSKQVNSTAPSTNKITMTTTYVYKRISQQPDIDLNLECEEEDLVYVMPPASPPRQSPVKEPELEQVKANEASSSFNLIPEQTSENSDLLNEITEAPKQLNDSPISNKKAKLTSRQKATTKLDEDIKITSTSPSLQPVQLTKVLKKNTQITQVTPGAKQPINNNKNGVKSPALTAALIETEISDGSDHESSDFEENEEPDQLKTSLTTSEKRLILKQQLNTNIKLDSTSLLDSSNKCNSYANVLGKFYSRRHGSMASALEMAALEVEQAMANTLSKLGKKEGSSPVNNLINKRSKQSTALATLPLDLRIGNYPAKCNICNLILDNNIELTSHICSHLESSGSDPNAMTTYISPFDAVTTTCGVCDMTFQQPFDLIKHLDQKHMKQLGEYKCRICELQHSKLSDLVAHLNQMHVSQEMPYRCDACGFRTSFYADAIYHIKKEHKSTLRHFCPYCLKSLSLPFNEKLGYVQCQLFYSHLITHFNKHENDTLQPSKCKHCQKCILHVRYMKDHLATDHCINCKVEATRQHIIIDSSGSPNKCATKIKKVEDARGEIKTLLRSSNVNKTTDFIPTKIKKSEIINQIPVKREIKTEPPEIKDKTLNKAPVVNLRKRRRSNRLDDELTADTNSTNSKSSNLNSPANLYDFDDDIVDEKPSQVDVKDELTESSTNDVFDSGRSKLFRKYIKGRKSVRGKASTANKNNPTRLLENEIKADTEVKTELEPRSEQDLFSSPVRQPRKQKALKQTNVKTLSINSKYHNRRMLEVNRMDYTNSYYASAPKSPEVITTVLAGNVKFNANKNSFKCVECGDCDLKTHFKNDYTCHQCKYNTNCSNSFEYHLHGHLVSKRIALWNKVLKIETEEYKCPCGFVINSTKDNSLNANTGNKVAAHLLKCEFKHCNVYLEEESKETTKSQPNEESANLPVVILNEPAS